MFHPPHHHPHPLKPPLPPIPSLTRQTSPLQIERLRFIIKERNLVLAIIIPNQRRVAFLKLEHVLFSTIVCRPLCVVAGSVGILVVDEIDPGLLVL